MEEGNYLCYEIIEISIIGTKSSKWKARLYIVYMELYLSFVLFLLRERL